MVDVAQLAEHQIVALVVVGSSPIVHPIFTHYDNCLLIFCSRDPCDRIITIYFETASG